MGDMTPERAGAALGIQIDRLDPIKENAYCSIYRAETPGGVVILKKYKGEDQALARTEVEALELYHELASNDPGLLDSKAVAFNPEDNLLAIQHVPGRPFGDVIREGRWRRASRRSALRLMTVLGQTLRWFRDRTVDSGRPTTQFMYEYLGYCSRELESLPIPARMWFRGLATDAEALSEAFEAANLSSSFAHGDFVFANMHAEADRVGLFDFANAMWRSHALNDAYNLRFALGDMLLPGKYRRLLADAFRSGLGETDYPDIAHRFYYEFHRRRWLMLKLRSRNPFHWAQAVRGMATFAREYHPRKRFV